MDLGEDWGAWLKFGQERNLCHNLYYMQYWCNGHLWQTNLIFYSVGLLPLTIPWKLFSAVYSWSEDYIALFHWIILIPELLFAPDLDPPWKSFNSLGNMHFGGPWAFFLSLSLLLASFLFSSFVLMLTFFSGRVLNQHDVNNTTSCVDGFHMSISNPHTPVGCFAGIQTQPVLDRIVLPPASIHPNLHHVFLCQHLTTYPASHPARNPQGAPGSFLSLYTYQANHPILITNFTPECS